MKKLIYTCIFVYLHSFVHAQINPEDSTVQVIGFWDKGEKQSYSVIMDRFKKLGEDTTLRERITYDLDVTVQDSTKDSYIIEWHYYNISDNLSDPVMKKLVRLNENTKIRIRTDEFGAVQEVVNWEEVRNHIKGGLKVVKGEFKLTPDISEMLGKIENQYTTKEAIEGGVIKDVWQFYSYHGGKYMLGETLTGKTQVANMFGGKPFDSDLTVYLDEINVEDNNYILRSALTVDSQQLTEVTLQYLNSMAKAKGEKLIGRDEIRDLVNETISASRIHGSGWVIYSIETKTVTSDNYSLIEERIIEIK